MKTLEGVTILNEYINNTSKFADIGFLILIGLIGLVVGYALVCSIIEQEVGSSLFCGIVFLFLLSIIFICVDSTFFQQEYKMYQITISDKVKYNEFVKRYEVIE